MNEMQKIDELFGILESKDDKIRYNAFKELLEITHRNVSWVYDKWDILIDKLASDNSYQRSIGLMLLANLSKSDSENKVSSVLNNFFEHFNDEKFITSRQCIQNVWKTAIYNDYNRKKVIGELEKTYYDNIHLNKHGNLIKQDVVMSLNQIYLHTNEIAIQDMVNDLIDNEIDEKLKKSLKKIIK